MIAKTFKYAAVIPCLLATFVAPVWAFFLLYIHILYKITESDVRKSHVPDLIHGNADNTQCTIIIALEVIQVKKSSFSWLTDLQHI